MKTPQHASFSRLYSRPHHRDKYPLIQRAAGLSAVVALLGTITMTLASPLLAAPTAIAAKAVDAQKLVLEADEKLGGVSARLQGDTGPKATRYFFIEGVSVMSPISVRVLAVDPAKPVKVSLHRGFWNRSEKIGITNKQGDFAFDTRIDGDLGIAVGADEPAAFYLLIWSDKPVEVAMPKMLFIDGKLVDLNAEAKQ